MEQLKQLFANIKPTHMIIALLVVAILIMIALYVFGKGKTKKENIVLSQIPDDTQWLSSIAQEVNQHYNYDN